MSLLSFPIGTALGSYPLWVLTRSEVRQSLGTALFGDLIQQAAYRVDNRHTD
jgi:hypothetical protein